MLEIITDPEMVKDQSSNDPVDVTIGRRKYHTLGDNVFKGFPCIEGLSRLIISFKAAGGDS